MCQACAEHERRENDPLNGVATERSIDKGGGEFEEMEEDIGKAGGKRMGSSV